MPFGPEVFIVIGAIVLLFGSTKLPQLARSLGSAKTEFEQASKATPSSTATPVNASTNVPADANTPTTATTTTVVSPTTAP